MAEQRSRGAADGADRRAGGGGGGGAYLCRTLVHGHGAAARDEAVLSSGQAEQGGGEREAHHASWWCGNRRNCCRSGANLGAKSFGAAMQLRSLLGPDGLLILPPCAIRPRSDDFLTGIVHTTTQKIFTA